MKRVILIALFLLTCAGCRQGDLHSNLQEIEADEIMVILHQNGIEAKKEKEISGQDVSWKITVKESDVPSARQILIANNLPRKRELGLSGVYKEKGLIPTPDEQKARFLLALKGEIINSLLRIPGVVDVDVVLNVPTENEFAELDPVKRKPTASVVVKTRNDALVAQTVTEAKLQQFVANTVPNLDPNDVAVIISRADTGAMATLIQNAYVPSTPASPAQAADPEAPTPEELGSPAADVVQVAGVRMDPSSVGRFKIYIVGLLLLLVGVSAFLLFNIMRMNRLRLRVQRGGGNRQALGGGQSAGLLGDGHPGAGLEAGYEVGAQQRQM